MCLHCQLEEEDATHAFFSCPHINIAGLALLGWVQGAVPDLSPERAVQLQLGDDLPQGGKRILWNVLMGGSLVLTGVAAAYTATTKNLWGFPIGTVGIIVFIILVIFGQIHMNKKHKKEANASSDAAE